MSDRPAHILIVEDEPKLANLLAGYLHTAAYRTEIVSDGLVVIDTFKHSHPDLILLDLMLPGRNGLDICQELRSFSDVPIVMMTARVEEVDRLLGLDAGADDYICKPYSPREVVARVRAILRRQRHDPPTPSTGLVLDDDRLRASLNGCALELTAVEFRLLKTLAAMPGRIYSRDKLLDQLYDDGRAVTDRAVDSHIKNLRRKLETACPDQTLIRSVYGAGYCYEPADTQPM